MPTLLEAARMKKAELEAAEEAKKHAIAVKAAPARAPAKPAVEIEPETEIDNIGGYVPSTDALRVAVKMLTGVTVRGSGADARRVIQAWKGKIPKARKQH